MTTQWGAFALTKAPKNRSITKKARADDPRQHKYKVTRRKEGHIDSLTS